jgi:hypothetical protein
MITIAVVSLLVGLGLSAFWKASGWIGLWFRKLWKVLQVVFLVVFGLFCIVGLCWPRMFVIIFNYLYAVYIHPIIPKFFGLFSQLESTTPPLAPIPMFFEPIVGFSYLIGLGLLLLILVISWWLFKRCRKQISGGRPGQLDEQQSTLNSQNTSTEGNPVFLSTIIPLKDMLKSLFNKDSTSNPPANLTGISQDQFQEIMRKLDILLHQLSNNHKNNLGGSAIPTFAMETKPVISTEMEPQLPNPQSIIPGPTVMDPTLVDKLSKMTIEEATQELKEELKRQREAKRKPVYLTEAEKAMPVEQLYLKLKEDNVRARESEFLQNLPSLPTNVRDWSLTDIKRWFRDQRHEQWAIRQVQQGKTLFICPHCNRARDMSSHRCIPLWKRPIIRKGVPMQHQTYLAPSSQGFRVGSKTVNDPEKMVALTNRISNARNESIEANARLARVQATIQPGIASDTKEASQHVISEDQIFPYATNPTLQPYMQPHNSQPVIDLTDDTEMGIPEPDAIENSQQSINTIQTYPITYGSPIPQYYYYMPAIPHSFGGSTQNFQFGNPNFPPLK